ncbi:MAG: DUF4215 domain-containing protein [Deltaproteobacteria bacterium]|nr:DUF4215 domain-containing protein [Deltaproteobacteria bacterium]
MRSIQMLWISAAAMAAFACLPACSSDSAAEQVCGDGVQQPPEECDDGNTEDGDGCSADCKTEGPRCGDGIPQAPEECDDGNNTDGDGCSADCHNEVTPRCGDGIPQAPEECDDGQNGDNCDGCLDDCTLHSNTCGDTYRCDIEECDDGNNTDGDGCSADCHNEFAPRCGDGVTQAPEQCDDGNGVLTDDCPDGPLGTCVWATCGDGYVNLIGPSRPIEQCDDANGVDADLCSNACTVNPSCGIDQDGDMNLLDPGEECDLGPANSDTASGQCPGVCRTDCRCPYCGDYTVDFVRGEECDDGNNTDGDGCSAACTIEAATTCGNGTWDIDQGEECDDGGTANGDGCDDACQFEPLGQSCGDNNPDLNEKCDDGNTANGDGCNPTCNLTTTVTTLASGVLGDALAVDDTYLWIGTCDPPTGPTVCQIARVPIDACLQTGSCTPSVVAGGACGAPQDGQGTSAVLACTNSMTTDGSTLWFANQHTIRAMDMQTFDVVTVAGSPNSCAAVDGMGASAYFHDIRGLTYEGGYIYLLDGCEEVLRRLDPATGMVVTIAGTRVADPAVTQSPPYTCPGSFNCVSNTPADGYGLAAVFGSPRYMASDRSGNLYITDTNGVSLRSYKISTGWVGTLVGGAGYQDGQGAAVRLSRPRALTSDGTSIYVNEQLAHTVRQVLIQSLDTSTLVGVRGCPGSRDGVGGDGSQDWSVAGCGTAPAGLVLLDTPMAGLAYHFPSRSIFLVESNNLRRIE